MKTLPFSTLALISTLCFVCNTVNAQGAETLLDSETKFDSMWSLELKTNSIQEELGSQIGIYWGAVVNRTLIFGIGGVTNLTHTVTNYGGLQLLAQYIQDPDKLIHYGEQIIFGFASVKDYQNPKTGLFDNFANTSGTNYYFLEPRLNAEMNITKSEKLVLGLSYCFAFGLDEQNRNIARSKVTKKDLSGVQLTIGVKFGNY
jgi:hypothetical protein